MLSKLFLAGAMSATVLPIAGCSHDHHDHDRDRVVLVPRERVRYVHRYEHHDSRYYNTGWRDRDCR